TGAADADRPAVSGLPALRRARHGPHGAVRRHRLQIAVPLHRVRRTVRRGEGPMSVATEPGTGQQGINEQGTGQQGSSEQGTSEQGTGGQDSSVAPATASGQPRSRNAFYPLRVSGVEPLTGDSPALTSAVPAGLTDLFAFAPGQFLTVRRGGERRSYSICAPAGAAP